MKENSNISSQPNEQLRRIIIETIKKDMPATSENLIKLIQKKTTIPREEITKYLLELEQQGKISFATKEQENLTTFPAYFFSKKSTWYWTTIIMALTASLTVFLVPNDAFPTIYIRYVLGTILVLFLPGFTFIKTLCPLRMPIATNDKKMDAIELIALSIIMSITFATLAGLILNYTAGGIRLEPTMLILLPLTIAFATAAILREYTQKHHF